MPPKGRSGKDFKIFKDAEHVYKIPDMYVGSIERILTPEWIYDFETRRMKYIELDLPDAVKRIFLEIISNAGDNSYFSRLEGVDPGVIEFSWDDDGYLSVKNGGLPMPVEPFSNEDGTYDTEKLTLIPDHSFGTLRTSTNYDEEKERVGCGRNGFGSKLTNIFSKHFIVEIGDSGRQDEKGKPISGQHYIGEWKNNMKDKIKSEVEPGFDLDTKKGQWSRRKEGAYTGPSFVQVTWLMDFAKMGSKKNQYSKEELGLFSKYAMEFSLTCGVPISINGVQFDFRSIRKFASLFYPEETMATAVSHFCTSKEQPFPKEWAKLKKSPEKEAFIEKSGFIPESQVLLLDTPDEGQTFTYVNGLVTSEGGVHVDKLHKELFGPIVTHMNEKHKGITRLTIKDVKPHVTVFLINRVLNSKYNSQSKTKLMSPTPNINFTPDHIKTLLSDEWRLEERLQNTIGAKNVKGLSKSDGKKVSNVKVKGLTDANDAGRSKSANCTLYIVEGQSAGTYPERRISFEEGGRDLNGFYTLQGKVMNVLTRSPEKIAAYKEFENLKKALGLKQDTDYTLDSNFKTLRYGKVIILTDADSDGMHILGLVINLFYHFWPSLFERNYIRQLVTPVIRAYGKKKDEVYRFYDERTFEKWYAENPGLVKKENIIYYKGLGSSEKDEVKDDMKTAPVMIINNDDAGKDLIMKAFDKTRSHDRKIWIQEWRDIVETIPPFTPRGILGKRPTSEVMGVHFPPYMIDNLVRSIPCMYDGLKKSQRQILYTALDLYNYGKKYSESIRKGDKMPVFSGKVMSYSHYHHGEKSLTDATFKMMRDYPGTNNLPILRATCATGTRDSGGKNDPQSRYASLTCPWWMQYVFNKEMIDLIPRRNVDGDDAEPLWIPCDIPLGIINGCQGVATGWSTYIPMHHPISIVDWILERLAGRKRIEPLAPYFHGFRGAINIAHKTPKKLGGDPDRGSSSIESSSVELSDDESNPDEEYIPDFIAGRGFNMQGKFQIKKEHSSRNTVDVIITEIPLTITTNDYIKFVDSLIEGGKAKDKRNNSPINGVQIEIIELDARLATLEGLKLERGLPLTNMVMLDTDGIPTKYGSVESILANYITEMVSMYEVYKKHTIGKDKERLAKMNMKLAIILAFLEKRLILQDRSDDQVNEQLEKLSLDRKIFDELGLRQLTKTKMDQLKKEIGNLEESLKIFTKKSPESLWSDRLNAFKAEFLRRKVYNLPYCHSIEVSDTVNAILDDELTYKKARVNYFIE